MVLRVKFKTPYNIDDSLDLNGNSSTPFSNYITSQNWGNSRATLKSLIGGDLRLQLKSLINTSGPIDNSEIAQKLAVRLKTSTNAFDPMDVLTQQQNLQWRLKTSTNALGSTNTETLQQKLAVQLKGSVNYFNPQDNPASSQPSLEYRLKTVTMNATSNLNTMLVASVGQSANNLLGKVNSIAKTTIDTTGLLNTKQNLELNRGIVGQANRLVNDPKFLQAYAVLSSSAPLQMTDEHRQTLLATANQAIETAKGLSKTGNVHANATTEIERTDSEREMGNRIIGNQLQKGMNFVENAMRDGHTTLAGIRGVAKEAGMGAYLPTDEVINKKLDTYNIQAEHLTRKDIEEGMYGGLTRVIKEQNQSGNTKEGKTISTALLGLGISTIGAYGATIGRSSVLEYAGFTKNTIGSGYDYGSPFGNVIQQQSNIRQGGISIASSGVGAIIGGILGRSAGAFIGGATGNAFGTMATAIGGSKDTLQAQAHAEYDQQAMMMQTLFATRTDAQRMMGMFGSNDRNNILDVMTPTRMMVAKGGISVDNTLTDYWINKTSKEAVASNMSYSQSEQYGYNKAVIGRYQGGSDLDLGKLSKSANVDVGDLAQRTLEYIPFTRGDAKSASDMAQKSFSQASGLTARQLAGGNEGYLSFFSKDMIAHSFLKESYKDLLLNKGGSLDKLGARANKLGANADPTALALTNYLDIGPSNMTYGMQSQKLSPSTTLQPTKQQGFFMNLQDDIRNHAYIGQTSQADVNQQLNVFENNLSGANIQLRDWVDTVHDTMTAIQDFGKALTNTGSTGSK